MMYIKSPLPTWPFKHLNYLLDLSVPNSSQPIRFINYWRGSDEGSGWNRNKHEEDHQHLEYAVASAKAVIVPAS